MTTSVRSWGEMAGDTVASGAIGYVGKVAYDFTYSVLTGQAYTAAANLNSFAAGGAILYVVNAVSQHIFKSLGMDNTADQKVIRGIVAVQLTTLVLIPLNVTLAVKGILMLYPAIYLGEKLVDKLKSLL